MTSPSPADSHCTFSQNVSQQFAGRPTFEQVARQALQQAIQKKFPTLNIDLSKTKLAIPDTASRSWNFQPFMRVVLNYLSLGTPLDFTPRGNYDYYLSDAPPHRLKSDGYSLKMNVIAKLVRELPTTIAIELEEALTRYWNADIDDAPQADDHPPTNRWQWFSDTLRNMLHIQGLQQPGLSEPAREALDQIVRWPDREQRFKNNVRPVYAYSLESVVTYGASTTQLPSNEILLLHYNPDGLVIVLCGPGSAAQAFKSLDAFNDFWAKRIANAYTVDSVTCQRYEIGGNAFDTQAQLILEQQLANLRAVQLPSRIGPKQLGRLYSELSDPARSMGGATCLAPQTAAQLRPILPDWLKTASSVDQARFQRYSLAMASVKKHSQAHPPVSDIRAFTADALLSQMRKTNDNAKAKADPSHFQPDDVELIFTVSAGYPGTVGISEKRTMSLTQLAIDNLIARPSGNLALSHRRGSTLPTWLTPELITRRGGLIEQVDIGTTYPRYLQQELLGDSSQALDYQWVFAEQVSAQLPLEALQQVLGNANGMTRQGLRLIEALLQPDAGDQQADGRPVVIQHLAFLRKPLAQPDIVSNMFIIEAQDTRAGPHVLYRPLYTPVLMEFPTRQALLQSVISDTELQKSVLTWMSDDARPVYANGGFLQPHIVRFFQGDEFSVPEVPAPATLAIQAESDELLQYLRNGKLMQYLYGCNAQALITQADRASVSNRESRWAVLLKGGNLLFNTLLFPLLRGPTMTVAWLWSLMAAASHDIPDLGSEDPVTRELAAVDLLVNLAMLVAQFPSIQAPARPSVPVSIKEQAMHAPAPRLVAQQWPAPDLPSIRQGSIALPGEHPNTFLDFSFSNPRNRLTQEQRTRIQRMQVPRPASLPTPIPYGPLKGLYVIAGKWHALLQDGLYRIDLDPEGQITIFDPFDPARTGPALRADSEGNWSLDLRLRLLGGAPPKRVADLRRQNARRTAELTSELNNYLAQESNQQQALDVAQRVMARLEEGSGYSEEQRAPKRKIFYDLLNDQTNIYLKFLGSAPERARLGIGLTNETQRALMENVINNARKAVLVVEMELQALITAHPEYVLKLARDALVRDIQGYVNYLDALSAINDRAIHWLELKDNYLERLLNLDSVGAQAFERLTQNRPPNERNVIGTKAFQLTSLALLAVKNLGSDLSDCLYLIVKPLAQQMRSHADLQLYELPPSDQLEVLTSLTEHYGEALDALQGMKTLYADDIQEANFDRLIKLVDSLYQDTSGKLAAEVKPEPTPRRRAPKRSKAPSGQPQKRVIKTRKNGVLIGDLKPAGTSLPIEVVELRSQVDDEVIATYSQHGEVWDAVDIRRPAPAPKTRSINAIKRDARQLLDQLDVRLRRAEGYKSRCRHPQEIEEIMNNEASRFRTISEELDRAYAARQTERTQADQALSQNLAEAISKLAAKGTALRIELSMRLPPTDGNLSYLFEKNLIQVARLGGRKALKGTRKDFLQEYAVNDRNGAALWYAHFHYEKIDTPKANYSVAHLKTKEQRREDYYSLLSKANSPYAVVNVHRGTIGKPLAQSKFLPLAT
ncbi:dermonecrotic toxin domain-containing protein [Pseudomonas sp. ABY48]|uniref:dermonecrotic toxin domain-containing protein n=1 Tax=Pseudomonas sp. ABY48 TaxID=3402865 RepID=UPI003B439F08